MSFYAIAVRATRAGEKDRCSILVANEYYLLP